MAIEFDLFRGFTVYCLLMTLHIYFIHLTNLTGTSWQFLNQPKNTTSKLP